MGCASQIWWGGGGPPAQSTVRISADGIATVITGIQDIGTGTLTTAQIVAAEELGLPRDRSVSSAATPGAVCTRRSRGAR